MGNENLSESIENYILYLLNNEDENYITMRRKELAEMFNCVPSQINYVLKSRFSPEQGFLIESKRGEYGFIRVSRISCESTVEKISHIDELIGSEFSLRETLRLLKSLNERNFITTRERLLIEIALKESEEPAALLKKILRGLMLA